MRWQALLMSLVVSAASVAGAAADTIFVAATDGPWSISRNPSMPYGLGDWNHTTPAILLLAPGANSVTITYESGTATGGILWPPAGPEGYPFNHIYPIEWGCGPGTSGGAGSQGILPCHYIDPNNVGPNIWVGALIAAFTDNSGVVVGNPFAPFATSVFPNYPPYSVGIPTGATELSFGYNDDLPGDNTGGWDIGVAYAPSAVPESSTWAMLLIGFMSMGLAAYRATKIKEADLMRGTSSGERGHDYTATILRQQDGVYHRRADEVGGCHEPPYAFLSVSAARAAK